MYHNRRSLLQAGILALVLTIGVILMSAMPAEAALTVEPITWNIIGLDSNSVTVGPNQFPVGVRIRNTGGTNATSVAAAFVWDSANSYIDLYPSTTTTSTIGTIVAGGYKDAYFTVAVTRDAAAYDTARRYHINITASGLPAVSTPTPRELYVERLVSESRSSEVEVKLGATPIPPEGTMNLVVNNNYTIVLTSNTAAQGCNQLEALLNMPSSIFQILSVSTTFTVDSSPLSSPVDKLYLDACGWENDLNGPNYRSCGGGDYNAGGTVTTTYQVKVLKLPITPLTNPVRISSLIYDFSGATYHYNSDYDVAARYVHITDPTQIQISKTFVPDNIAPGAISTLMFSLSNPTSGTITGINFTDTFPAGIVVASPTGVTYSGLGSGAFSPALTGGEASVSFSNATIAKNCTGTATVNVTRAIAGGPFTNTTGPLYINGTTNTGETASDDLTVSNTTSPCTGRGTLAEWQVPKSASNPPDTGGSLPSVPGTATVIHSLVDTATAVPCLANTTNSKIDNEGYNGSDNGSWKISGNGGAGNYIQFTVDTSNYSQVQIAFHQKRDDTTHSATQILIKYGDGTNFLQNGDPITLPNDKNWHLLNAASNPLQLDFTGKTNTQGETYFRIQPIGATDNTYFTKFDYITISGIHCTPPPTVTKYFGTDPILVTVPPLSPSPNVSLLTFTISNTLTTPNHSQSLTGVNFTDTLPAGLLIYNQAPYDASFTWFSGTLSAPHRGSTISLSGIMLDPDETCTASVYVYGTVAGVYNNVSGYITSDQTPNNMGYASDSIAVRAPSAGIQLLKQASSSPSGPWVSYLAVEEGGPVYYHYTIENTGNVELSPVTVEDPIGTVIQTWASLPAPDPANENHIVTYNFGSIAAIAGTHVNTAEANGTYSGTTYTDTDSATYATAELTIVKVAEEDSYSTAGDELHYTYTVANTGYAPLEGPVTVIDDIATGESCQALTAIGDLDNYFDPGESVTCTATYTVTATDVSNGSVTNTAYATADGFESDPKSVTVNSLLLTADLEVVKACEPVIPGYPLQQLVYVITVTNNGPDQATNVALTDAVPAGPGILTSVEYTIDGAGPYPYPWPGPSLDLANMNAGTSKEIRIYAVVPVGFSSSNTASVASDTTDPIITNNSSTCTSAEIPTKRQALDFLQADPLNYYVTVNNSPTLETMTTKGTIEAWICPKTTFTADAGIVFKGEPDAPNPDDGICYGFGFGGGGSVFTGGTSQNIGFVIESSSGTRYLLTATRTTLKLNRWYHIACVWDADAAAAVKMIIYIDGLVEAVRITPIDNARTNNDALMFGMQNITPAKFPGVMDEVRVWSTTRTRTQIRDAMCKKLTGTELGLVGYWRFDEVSGDTCFDSSSNGNSGTLTNAVRICSQAPLGDASLWDYAGTVPEAFTQNLASAYGDNITVTGDGGTWNIASRSGLQVYRVDDAPSPASAPIGWKSFTSAPHYWGVFVTGGIDPSYKIIYNYTRYPGIIDEDSLQMAYRHHNCETWKDLNAELDAPTDTLTKEELSGTEFILGSYMDPRNAIEYDGTDYVTVADDPTLDLTDTGTLEAWIYPYDFTADAGIVFKGTSDVCYGFGFGSGTNVFTTASAHNIGFVVGDSSGGADYLLTGTTNLTPNTWHHIACVWENTGVADFMTIYINGVQETTSASNIDNAATTNGEAVNIGRQLITPAYFNGLIDEVRIWNSARTQTEIRDTMCKKVTSADAGFTNLMGYWRFDEETTSTVSPDYTSNGNDATMTNFADVLADRVCSEAPIGDDSGYTYYDSGANTPVFAQVTHTDGDYLFATENTGTWNATFTGLQLYVLNEAPVYPPDIGTSPYAQSPNGLTPPAGWSSIDYYRYWGVFLTDWLNPPITYDVTYNYNGNPSVPVNETQLGLAKRDEYCDRTWADTNAALNTTANTLIKTLESGTEYILGGKDDPLAIVLASFTAEVKGGCIGISWETATEIGTIGFELWRSQQKDGAYEKVPGSYTRSEAVMETMGATYSFTDCDVALDGKTVYYYKLEEIDLDNTKDNPLYGPIGPVPDRVTATQPGSTRSKNDKACFISILSEQY